jgi:aminoglycoside 2''-phosphotransferase
MRSSTEYAQVIHQAYPSLVIKSARLNNDGQYNDVLLLNDDLIFRFPRYPIGVKTIFNEVHILSRIRDYLPLPVPDPIYTSKGTDTVGEVFMGYRRISGDPLQRDIFQSLDDVVLGRWASQMASFLQALHSIPLEEVAIDLPVSDGPAEWTDLFAEFRRHLFPFMRPDACQWTTYHFEAYLNAPQLHNYQPALRHGDFGAGNILIDREKMILSGVIDFGFAGVGDQAVDIAAVSTLGDSFFTRFQDSYPGIDSLLDRARFYRGTYALYEALHGIKHGDEKAFNAGISAYI